MSQDSDPYDCQIPELAFARLELDAICRREDAPEEVPSPRFPRQGPAYVQSIGEPDVQMLGTVDEFSRGPHSVERRLEDLGVRAIAGPDERYVRTDATGVITLEAPSSAFVSDLGPGSNGSVLSSPSVPFPPAEAADFVERDRRAPAFDEPPATLRGLSGVGEPPLDDTGIDWGVKELWSPDDRVRRLVTVTEPFRSICAIYYTRQIDAQLPPSASGFMARDRVLVTNAHVATRKVDDGNKQVPKDPDTFAIVPGQARVSDGTPPYHYAVNPQSPYMNRIDAWNPFWATTVDATYILAGYFLAKYRPDSDMAFMVLRPAAGLYGIRPTSFGLIDAPLWYFWRSKNKRGHVAGYPATPTCSPPFGKGPCGGGLWQASGRSWEGGTDYYIAYRLDTSDGMSGGPLWIFWDGDRKAVGVHAQAGNALAYGCKFTGWRIGKISELGSENPLPH